MNKAVLFKKLANGLVECQACSWYCKIAPGQVGVCGTRLNKKGELYSLVYGKAVGLAVDPVEKKPLYHFLPGAKILSFGTLGCNFGCLFCQNWQMSQTSRNKRLKIKDKKLVKKEMTELIDQMSEDYSPEELVKTAVKQGASGIAYTYNEPAVFVEYAYDTARLAKRRGLKNIYVSNGFESAETFDLMKDYLDGINIDLKSFDNMFYQRVCKGKIEPVKKNIKNFFAAGIKTEVTTLVIPGLNDSQSELTQIAQFLAEISKDIPWHISAFYPAYKMVGVPATSRQSLIKAHQIGKKAGLKYVYLGNVFDIKRSSTYCPKCREVLVFRDGYFVEVKGLDKEKGVCKSCGEKIYGLWDH